MGMKFKPPGIKDIGLPVYLENMRDKHNGLGWNDFDQRMKLGTPKTKIAIEFGKSPQAIWHWVKIYKEKVGNRG